MSDYNENEYIRTRRRSLNPSAGLIRRAREDPNSSNEEVYIQHRRNPQDDYYPQMYHADTERERGRSTSTTRSNTRRSTYYEDSPVRRGSESRSLSPQFYGESTVARVGTTQLEHSRRGSSVDSRYSDSDAESYPYSEDERERKKLRNREIIYTSLAAATTVAAANNIYQSTKAQQARRRALRNGTMHPAEAMLAKNKALVLDLLGVGVAAIGVNNAVNGWKKLQDEKQAREEAHREFDRRREQRKMLTVGSDDYR